MTTAVQAVPEFTRMQPELVRDRWHRYKLGDEPVRPSITTVIGKMDKPSLLWWAAGMAAAKVVCHAEAVDADPNKAEEFLKLCHDYKAIRKTFDESRGEKADIGTQCHYIAERFARVEPVKYDDMLAGVKDRMHLFETFLQRLKPVFHLAEFPCFSDAYWFAGTPDAYLSLDLNDGRGVCRWLWDYKSGAGLYGCDKEEPEDPIEKVYWRNRSKNGEAIFPVENAMQLTAVSMCEFYYDTASMSRKPLPPIDRLGVVSIRPDACELWEWPMEPIFKHAFVGLLAVEKMQKAKTEPKLIYREAANGSGARKG